MKAYIYVTKSMPFLMEMDYSEIKNRYGIEKANAIFSAKRKMFICKTLSDLMREDEPANGYEWEECKKEYRDDYSCNGKIVASFELSEAIEFNADGAGIWQSGGSEGQNEILLKSRLSLQKISDYCHCKNVSKDTLGYALVINGLEILESPLKLSDVGLKRAPQSYCYGMREGEKVLVYSIHSEPACDILDLFKTFEIRKSCPKGIKTI